MLLVFQVTMKVFMQNDKFQIISILHILHISFMIHVRENYFYFKALKVNQPPQAIVTPPTQVVTLPTKKAIIDGSSSTDDEDVSQLTYKWEIRKNPIKYEIPTQHSTDPTLTLDNLVAGNYTIRLTVTDANGRKMKY